MNNVIKFNQNKTNIYHKLNTNYSIIFILYLRNIKTYTNIYIFDKINQIQLSNTNVIKHIIKLIIWNY